MHLCVGLPLFLAIMRFICEIGHPQSSYNPILQIIGSLLYDEKLQISPSFPLAIIERRKWLKFKIFVLQRPLV